jgi:hypothetical protein
MSSPDWSKIPFEKMPEWKRKELLGSNQKAIKEMKALNKLECKECGKVCKSKAGLLAHKRSHNK